MTLLDNELVRKYFGCQDCQEGNSEHVEKLCHEGMALKILRAMQEPIKKGERYLLIDSEIVGDMVANSNSLDHIRHLGVLRLPGRFQKHKTASQKCGCGLIWNTIHRFDGPCHILENQPTLESERTHPYVWKGSEPEEKMKKTFRTCDNKGFQITFPNGVTLSTQFGWGNYCENHDKDMPDYKLPKPDETSDDCEIAIIDGNGNWITKQFKDKDDNVLGWVKVNEWLEAFDFCRNWKPKK